LKKKVMIANYDPNVLKEQKKAFEGMNVDVKTVRDGEAALAEVTPFQPDMLLLDPMLPKVSGFDVAQKIRETMPDLPIIMLTAVYRGMVYRTQALDKYGATEYLEEPVPLERLRAVIEKYIGTPVRKIKEKKHHTSSKKRLEELVQVTKSDSKAKKRKKIRPKEKSKTKRTLKKTDTHSENKVPAKPKSTRKKLEAIMKESHVR